MAPDSHDAKFEIENFVERWYLCIKRFLFATVLAVAGLLEATEPCIQLVRIRTDGTVVAQSSSLESLGQLARQFRRRVLLAFLGRFRRHGFTRSLHVFAV